MRTCSCSGRTGWPRCPTSSTACAPDRMSASLTWAAERVHALAAMRRLAGSDGTVLIADMEVADDSTSPGDLVERLMYGFSVLVCLPDSLSSPDSAATGTLMRQDTLRYAEQAGYATSRRCRSSTTCGGSTAFSPNRSRSRARPPRPGSPQDARHPGQQSASGGLITRGGTPYVDRTDDPADVAATTRRSFSSGTVRTPWSTRVTPSTSSASHTSPAPLLRGRW